MKIINKKTISEYLSNYISYFSVEEIESFIELPPPTINFTYAFPCFRLSNFEKMAPHLIAEDLVEKLIKPDFMDKIEANEKGYINFRIKKDLILENTFTLKENYGKRSEILNKEKPKPLKIIIEYPSPNTNKPLHLGHIRNMLLGNTISNFFKYKGQEVFQVNLNNDRGVHICKSMLAYQKWGKNQEPTKKSDHYVGDFYVIYSKEEEEDKNLNEEVKNMLNLWENEDPQIRALWKKMNKWAIDGFKETYQKFDISFDKEYLESDLYKHGKEIILKNVEKGILNKTEDGAIIANLKEKFNLPNKILLRSDGTSIYITQDIYLAYLKKKDFDYDKSIYVVGNEQDTYFKQLFAILDLIGFKEDKYHFSYGMINLPEGKMKSREGTVVDADDLVEEMENLAFEEVKKRYPELSEVEKRRRANIIGMAALKFFILKIKPKSDFVFDPKKSLSFEGETGPYIQYCYARIESIISKSYEEVDLDIKYELLNHEKELSLIKQLHYFPEIVDQVINNYEIHLIPQFLLTLCQEFNSFYSACIVISDNKELERARLLLIKCVQIIIKIGLNLMGITTLEKM